MAVTTISPIGQLCTIDGKYDEYSPDKRTPGLGLIENAALVFEDDKIKWVGHEKNLPAEYQKADNIIDAAHRSVIPGLIDCHTHTVFGGSRLDEFDRRMRGESYLDILEAGGGIKSTVENTRKATPEALFNRALKFISFMKFLGVCTLEIKSGYGLNTETEIKMLRVIQRLGKESGLDIVATFLGAHTFPQEYVDRKDDFVELICNRMLPLVQKEDLAEFCDIFVEKGSFSYEQGRTIFSVAQSLGFKLRAHANQMSESGGIKLAAEFDALSVDHIEYANDDDIKLMREKNITGVLLPGAGLILKEEKKPAARKMIEEGVRLAIATDFNPGTSPTAHLPLCMTLACAMYDLYPYEALMGVTANAAAALGRDDRIGKLAPGFDADIVILETHDYRDMMYHFPGQQARTVIRKGKY